MSEYVSGIGPCIEKLFDYRCSLGYSGDTHHVTLLNFDRFCAARFPEAEELTEQMLLPDKDIQKCLGGGKSRHPEKGTSRCSCVRSAPPVCLCRADPLVGKWDFFESEAPLSVGIYGAKQPAGNLRLHPHSAGKSDAVFRH